MIHKQKINGKDVYLKKSRFGWKVVYPIKLDGKINYKHLIAGRSWWNILFIALFLMLLLGSIWEYTNALGVANECLAREYNQTNIGFGNLIFNDSFIKIIPSTDNKHR